MAGWSQGGDRLPPPAPPVATPLASFISSKGVDVLENHKIPAFTIFQWNRGSNNLKITHLK